MDGVGIIEEIYYGKICPYEEIAKKIPKFSEFSTKVSEKSEKIKKTLSEEQIRLFIEYDEILEEIHQLFEKHSFIEGFKMGAKLHAEISQEKI